MYELLKEVKNVFKHESYIHLGMDEVYPACWYEDKLKSILNK